MNDQSALSPVTRRALAQAKSHPAHRIVAVGGGAGGLELVTTLGDRLARRGRAEVTLVERNRTHLWKPLLHEVAAGSLDVDTHDLDYLAQAHWHGFRVRFGELTGLDRANRLVHVGSTVDAEGREIVRAGALPYDTLVMAIGSVSNDFGTPGVAEHAIALDTVAQARRFNARLINAIIRVDGQDGPIAPGQLHVAIVGAGATGAELAAELHRTARSIVAFGLDRVDPDRDVKITLIEGAPRILPALPERLSEKTTDILTRLGIDIRTNAKVARVRADGVELASGELVPAALTVWAAGVRGPAVLENLDGLETSRMRTLVVRETLQTTRDDDVFAIGDCAWFLADGADRPVPPRAQAAHQMASHMVGQIERRLRGKPLKPWRYKDFGSLVSLGHDGAVGNLMGFLSGKGLFIEGLIARIVYRSLYKMHQTALHGPARVAFDTAARLLSRRLEPRVKLH